MKNTCSNSSMVDPDLHCGVAGPGIDAGSNSSMVDPDVSTQATLRPSMIRSNSSMVDPDGIQPGRKLGICCVQIPLWSILTWRMLKQGLEEGGSNSSMVDPDLAEYLTRNSCPPCSNSSMVDPDKYPYWGRSPWR